MQSSNEPVKISVPFAQNGDKQVIPVASQVGVADGRASYNDGFPPITRIDILAGGVPPFGTDFNGILYAITNMLRWQNSGGVPKFDSAFSASIGGYPKGAVLQKATGIGWWISTVENNTSNPDGASPAGWVDAFAGVLSGLGTMSAQNANSVAITGGSISGIADLAIADGGTGASTKEQALANLGGAPLASPALTGTPTAPTAEAGTNNTQIANTAFMQAGIAALISGASGGLAATPAGLAAVLQGAMMTYAVGGGSANAHTATYTPAVTALVDGMVLRFRAANANTGAATFSPNGLAAKPILSASMTALTGGEIVAGSNVWLQYNATLSSWVSVLAGRIATNAEAIAGTNTEKSIVPSSLAAVIANLALGTASKKAAQTSTSDTTAGALMMVGAFNVGRNADAVAVPYMDAIDPSTDFNLIKSPGWYYRLLGGAAGSRNPNHPDGQATAVSGNGVNNYYWLLIAYYGDNVIQVAFPYLSSADATIATIKFRMLGGGTWTPWRAIMHSGNEKQIGVGQSPADVTASRAAATTYTNTTSKPIWVSITINASGGATSTARLSVAGVVVSTADASALGGATFRTVLTAIVPSGSTYSLDNLSGATIVNWSELR